MFGVDKKHVDHMNVLHVNSSDSVGGAAIAAYRIHSALREAGVNSNMLVLDKQSNDEYVFTPPMKYFKYLNFVVNKLSNQLLKLQNDDNEIYHSLNLFSLGLVKFINSSNYDIVHLHWINHEMISVSELSKIKKPVIWTLHDSWAFCGSEHHPMTENDSRYIHGYHINNRMRGTGLDINKLVWQRKLKLWKNLPLHVVTPSNWLNSCARKSQIFEGKEISTIHNGVNMKVYYPKNRLSSRKRFGLKSNAFIIIFGAYSGVSDKQKGGHIIEGILDHLNASLLEGETQIVVFGHSATQLDDGITDVGFINNDDDLASLYSAADVFLLPSIKENLPNTAVESISCGTPVIAFNQGGMSDIVEHERTGYLATPYSIDDLINGIDIFVQKQRSLGDPSGKSQRDCRAMAEAKFSTKIVAAQYCSVYRHKISSSFHQIERSK
jgi:glycosyltransferase involved in cell wall biosynthesis